MSLPPAQVQSDPVQARLSFQPGRLYKHSLVSSRFPGIQRPGRWQFLTLHFPLFSELSSWSMNINPCMGFLLYRNITLTILGECFGPNPGPGNDARRSQAAGSEKGILSTFPNLAHVLGTCLPGWLTTGTAGVLPSLFYMTSISNATRHLTSFPGVVRRAGNRSAPIPSIKNVGIRQDRCGLWRESVQGLVPSFYLSSKDI